MPKSWKKPSETYWRKPKKSLRRFLIFVAHFSKSKFSISSRRFFEPEFVPKAGKKLSETYGRIFWNHIAFVFFVWPGKSSPFWFQKAGFFNFKKTWRRCLSILSNNEQKLSLAHFLKSSRRFGPELCPKLGNAYRMPETLKAANKASDWVNYRSFLRSLSNNL